MGKKNYTVWSINFDSDNKATVGLSRSRRAKDNPYDKALEAAGGVKNGFITDFRDSYVSFIGKAVQQLKKYEIKERDRIIADIEVSNEPYVKDGNLMYMKGYKHIVYEFELPGSSADGTTPAQTPTNIDKNPIVGENQVPKQEEEDDDSLPF